LADSLVHEPELVILDEPTIGLDPHQIRSVRRLVKSLGRSHTILVSTHILSEVEMTCSRVLIMNGGRILAADTTQNLQGLASDAAQLVVEVKAPEAELRACWEAMAEVQSYDVAPAAGDYWRCLLTVRPEVDLRSAVYDEVSRRSWGMRELSLSRVSLEDIFVRVTRRADEDTDDGEEGF
jgi:ABC-2 type transport system ATP-binding protein